MQKQPGKPIENTLPVNELLVRAEQGDADCQYWAGIRYFQGEGVPEDPRRAVELCADAARQFHVRAIAFVAYCSYNGIVVPKNVRTAILMYRYAADEGYPPAQFTLGCFYVEGKVVRRNIRIALKWLNKAADQGSEDALLKLGGLYKDGKEVVEDPERACGYYRRAVDLGSAVGQYMYGSFVMKGVGVERNPVEALDLLDQAASQGLQDALDVQKHFEEFVRFDPAEARYPDFPVTHPLPVRRRTAVVMAFLGSPCCQAMATDLCNYAGEHPDDAEVALNDAAILLKVAVDKGQAVVAFSN